MNNDTIFDKAERYDKRKNTGATQVQIAKDEGVKEPTVSRVLKLRTLPKVEENRYRNMFRENKITEGAVLDLVDSSDDPEKRRMVLELAIQHCKARDTAAEGDKRTGRKGRSTDKGKVTVHEIRSAIRELSAKKEGKGHADAG